MTHAQSLPTEHSNAFETNLERPLLPTLQKHNAGFELVMYYFNINITI